MKKDRSKNTSFVIPTHLNSHPLMYLIDSLNETGAEKYLVTICSNSGVSSFGSDNWLFFKNFASREIITFGKELSCGIIIRRFEKLKDYDTGLPFKSICSVYVNNNSIFPRSAKETESAFSYDANGKPIKKEDLVRFIDFYDMLPNIKKQ